MDSGGAEISIHSGPEFVIHIAGIHIHIIPECVFTSPGIRNWVRRTRMGQGYTPAAIRLLARFGFERLALNRIEIVASVGNLRSQRAAEKAGPYREGVQRSRLIIHDKAHDAVMYSLIPTDFSH